VHVVQQLLRQCAAATPAHNSRLRSCVAGQAAASASELAQLLTSGVALLNLKSYTDCDDFVIYVEDKSCNDVDVACSTHELSSKKFLRSEK
jgi:hypothetical protein